ncbi:uncharacterized protein UV8b_03433 [Ustilaginoidea virens]|uniref:Uncharacterized protein n=1 Tax=Ustilaginoidea virens TaxID=1159556 RepID=A0A8E5MH39_USTVR|nr:uncharacterized protein UV8b_03433 [Ustilaginoidea virens]QUC19192.1 hypothetical protein UV8b_03433 [Ustilaginoidea virens]
MNLSLWGSPMRVLARISLAVFGGDDVHATTARFRSVKLYKLRYATCRGSRAFRLATSKLQRRLMLSRPNTAPDPTMPVTLEWKAVFRAVQPKHRSPARPAVGARPAPRRRRFRFGPLCRHGWALPAQHVAGAARFVANAIVPK